jgi:hypothetical protein
MLSSCLSSDDAGVVSSHSVMHSHHARIQWMGDHARSNNASGTYSKRHMKQIQTVLVCVAADGACQMCVARYGG